MAASKEVLRIAIDEQRRFHDELTSSYRSLRLKIITFIGAILTLLAFLYANPGNTIENVSALNRLFIPAELYGKIFYIIGIGSLLLALGRLIHGSRPNAFWSTPFGTDDFEKLSEDKEVEYLESLKNEYVKATKANLQEHGKRSVAIRDSFYPLLIGAIILIVLRYFQ